MKSHAIFIILWILNSILFYFVIKKQEAPNWALDIVIFISLGFLLVLLNQAIAKTDKSSK
jgi:predicted membrane channel-forming protein YqfA (hemolysin III family)